MGILVGLPKNGEGEKDFQVNWANPFGTQVEVRGPFLPSEWHTQSGVQLTWPHAGTDWAHMLTEVQECFTAIAREVAKRELLFIVAPNIDAVKSQIANRVNIDNVRFYECETNDTWARDHGAITLIDGGAPHLLDFCFNGWGQKFVAGLDNQITRKAFAAGHFNGTYCNKLDFVLEGGSIESDGMGTILTTSTCLMAPNRNETLNKKDIEERLLSYFHAQQVLWLDYGYLAGDDTDSHVDTLARLCPNNTIAYVKCEDKEDEHFEQLDQMEKQLCTFKTLSGEPYRLLALPMANCVKDHGERLPATYANFLIINGAVLYPTYNQPSNDAKAAEVLAEAFPDYDLIGIDCRVLIKQHGSLHCVTMQYPVGVIK